VIVLACDKVTKSFGIDIILNQITFSVNAGQRVGVVGGNGAGKSTLFKIREFPICHGTDSKGERDDN